MTIRTITILFILILLFSLTITAQEEILSARDLLQWFPMDTYETIYHEDRAAMKATNSYGVFNKYGRGHDIFLRGSLPLPQSLKDKWGSCTIALKVKLFVYIQKEGDKRRSKGGKMISSDIGSVSYAVESAGSFLGVFRFTDLASLLTSANEDGEISVTGDRFKKLPVYQFKTKIFGGETDNFFIYATDAGELLVCADLKLLKRMAAAGYGEEMNIFDDADYADLELLIPELGQAWIWTTIMPHIKVLAQKAEKDSVSSDVIQEKKEKLPRLFGEWTVTSHELGKEYVQKEINKFPSEEDARFRINDEKRFVARTTNNSTKAKVNSKKYEQDGGLVIASTTYDKNFVDLYNAAREKDKKLKEEKAKDEQKEK